MRTVAGPAGRSATWRLASIQRDDRSRTRAHLPVWTAPSTRPERPGLERLGRPVAHRAPHQHRQAGRTRLASRTSSRRSAAARSTAASALRRHIHHALYEPYTIRAADHAPRAESFPARLPFSNTSASAGVDRINRLPRVGCGRAIAPDAERDGVGAGNGVLETARRVCRRICRKIDGRFFDSRFLIADHDRRRRFQKKSHGQRNERCKDEEGCDDGPAAAARCQA